MICLINSLTMTTKKVSTGKKKSSVKKKVGVRSIRKRAQEIYLRRIEEGSPGDSESDWLQAEEELMRQ
jgi:hypothetical protein